MRDISHAEIIDIKSEDILLESWAGFFPHQHYMVSRDFWDCSVALWPRRTFEWKTSASIYGKPAEHFGPFKTDSLEGLQEWFAKRGVAEDVDLS
ncbi:MAG: hypothetical protein KAJ62_04595 [Desulfobacteraceae bacterium]|nr:hypothetical protein [Desulfobacteraceae bacterium]